MGCLLVTEGVHSGVYQFQGKWQHATRYSFEHTLLAFATVTALLRLATMSRIVLGGTAKTYSFSCPHFKDFIGVTYGNGGGHAVVPSYPILLPGHHNHPLSDIFTKYVGALSCLNHSFCLTARGTSCRPGRPVMRDL